MWPCPDKAALETKIDIFMLKILHFYAMILLCIRKEQRGYTCPYYVYVTDSYRLAANT